MKPFFKRLSYSFGNEDHLTEERALDIQPDDTVLAITASGDRPLNLLTRPCKKLISIDANILQNSLLNLKIQAMKQLDYPSYLAFLGLKGCDKRLQTFDSLKKKLEKSSREYFSKNQDKIEKGIIYQGAVEKLIFSASKGIRLIRGKKVRQLFSFNNLHEQKEFVEKKWHTWGLENLFKYALHPSLTRFFFKDPGLYDNTGAAAHIGQHIYQKCHHSLTTFPAKENLLLSLLFAGKVFEEGYPPYLQEEGTETIKQRADCIDVKTIDLITFLKEAKSNSIDCFSLSDVASYLKQKEFETVLTEMIRVGKPNARFCIRQFLSNHKVPKELESKINRDHTLEKELAEQDRCFFYRFLTGTLS